jgi:hypothetical protein
LKKGQHFRINLGTCRLYIQLQILEGQVQQNTNHHILFLFKKYQPTSKLAFHTTAMIMTRSVQCVSSASWIARLSLPSSFWKHKIKLNRIWYDLTRSTYHRINELSDRQFHVLYAWHYSAIITWRHSLRAMWKVNSYV